MAKARVIEPSRSNDEIRRLMLRYFYDRNKNATSTMGKKGSAIKISDIKAELKALHELSQQEVQSNLTYLLSQGWVEEKEVQKQFQAKGGTFIPSTTKFYQITAAGIDHIEGPGEFTMPKFHGIKVQATGQNIITLGDGNQINAKFGNLGQALVGLREAITNSGAPEAEKMSLVADIDTIQSHLAKRQPNRSIVKAAWETVRGAAAINGCAGLVQKVTGLIAGFLS
jgi:predicted transcriptional regulator